MRETRIEHVELVREARVDCIEPAIQFFIETVVPRFQSHETLPDQRELLIDGIEALVDGVEPLIHPRDEFAHAGLRLDNLADALFEERKPPFSWGHENTSYPNVVGDDGSIEICEES
jgi:hypothetical protein